MTADRTSRLLRRSAVVVCGHFAVRGFALMLRLRAYPNNLVGDASLLERPRRGCVTGGHRDARLHFLDRL